MDEKMKGLIKEFLPPIFLRFYNAARPRTYSWHGDYGNWEEARKASTGYDNSIILEKVKEASLKVKNDKGLSERDSVLLKRIEYSYPLLTALMWIAANEKGRLDIIDFGGALGSSYFQNRIFLKTLDAINWNVVEQSHFVECGRAFFEDERLRFFESIDECLGAQAPNAILFSSVVQYIEEPYALINDVINKGFEYIIFDRTAFNRRNIDRLVVQRVSPEIYEASYPCWFLNLERFKKIFERKYILIDEFIGSETIEDPRYPEFKGFIYRLK